MARNPITILHFNDVYNIEPQVHEPQGGAARMSAYIKSVKELQPLVLFSGDALNPSLMSIFLKGEQMVPILNAIGVHCAVYGNHDFDFGVDHLEDMAEQSKFPWLLSNITDKTTNLPLAHGKLTHMIDWQGWKVGLIGLVEQEWIDTLATVDPEDIIFHDFVQTGNQLATQLREQGADIVIALTHMRWPNDRKVAELVDVDLVLGGHDHDYVVEQVEGKYVIKSGTDFRNLSNISVTKNGTGFHINIKQVDLDSNVPQDPDVKIEVDKHVADIHGRMDEHLGNMGVTMDGRFSQIRSRETNLGNFICDIILEAVPADICLLNSGTFRSDRIHSKGPFKLRDLMTILPMVDLLCVIEISGRDLMKALENGVSQYPKLEGRFPQVSGVEFGFDPSKPPGQRVEPLLVKVQGEYLQLDKKYRLCTKEYIAGGKDGYDVFKDCPVVESSEQCPSISTAARNHFESVQILRHEKPCRSGHRQSLCSIVRRTVLIKRTISAFSSGINSPKFHGSTIPADIAFQYAQSHDMPDSTSIPDSKSEPVLTDLPKKQEYLKKQEFVKPEVPPLAASGRKHTFKNLAHSVVRQMSIHDIEKEQIDLCPKVEGRIFQYDEQRKENLLNQRGCVQPSIMDSIIAASSDEMNRRKTLHSDLSGHKPGDTIAIQGDETSSGNETISETKQGVKRHLDGDNNNTANKQADSFSETEAKKAKKD